MPTLGVGAPVVPVAVSGDGALGVPDDPSVVDAIRRGLAERSADAAS